jgi:2-methylcitrate dehydratase PrpD
MSLPHSAALALAMAPLAADGFALGVSDYETSLHDPHVKQIEARVRCEVDREVEAATTAESVPVRVVITLKDGAKHSVFVAAPKGSPSRPFVHRDHLARFGRELSKRWSATTCDDIIDMAENLADLDRVTRLTGLLASHSGESTP